MTSSAKLTRSAKMLIDQLMAITGWKVSLIYRDEDSEEPCGLLVGDQDFFELMTDDN